jgi:hypothetical protein
MPVRRLAVLLVALLSVAGPATGQPADRLQSPAAFLGEELGARFTPHHRVVDYVRHVAARSPRATVRQYGTSVEGRPLLLTALTTPDNHDRLDAIRRANLQRAGRRPGAPQTDVAVVWLSYNVHGDEPVSTEAALKTLYALADTSRARPQAWLENTVVLLEPCLNPDGRARYTQWFRRTVGARANPDPSAREHHPPWASGRTNHYYFDLNRDWAWGTQRETRERLDAYHRWMPNVHVDYHEMGVDDPYYFAPGAEPFHERLTEWQRDFQFTIGRHNAQAFDRNGWLYFTQEVFDLFYPGYGDTWPLFNGAIGMTYEQGGGARAGRAIETAAGDTLTLAERIAHHHATALSTVEVTAEHHEQVLREFAAYHRSARQDPPGAYRTYVVHRAGQGDRLDALTDLLDRQRIRYGYATERAAARGRSYRSGTTEPVTIEPGDLIVDAAQPKGRLVTVLFEPETTIVDSLTYDITAWGLPYAYGVEAHALPTAVDVDTAGTPPEAGPAVAAAERPYAYATPWRSRADARLAGALLQAGVQLRTVTEALRVDGRTYAPGTLLLTRADNASLDTFDATVQRLARAHDQPLYGLPTGLTADGPDLGSSTVQLLDRPRVAVLAGAPLAAARVGEVWHFFDQQIDYPATLLPAADFAPAMLDDVDVLVLPDGDYGDWLTKARARQLTRWTRRGGRLVVLGDAIDALAPRPAYTLTPKAADTTRDPAPAAYGTAPRERLPHATPGSIHRVALDSSHPLTYGIEAPYFTLKRNDDAYGIGTDGWAAGTLETGPAVSGFMGQTAEQSVDGTVLFGTQALGDGHVVYLVDNPLFRGFWYSGHVLFSNAVFMVGAR